MNNKGRKMENKKDITFKQEYLKWTISFKTKNDNKIYYDVFQYNSNGNTDEELFKIIGEMKKELKTCEKDEDIIFLKKTFRKETIFEEEEILKNNTK